MFCFFFLLMFLRKKGSKTSCVTFYNLLLILSISFVCIIVYPCAPIRLLCPERAIEQLCLFLSFLGTCLPSTIQLDGMIPKLLPPTPLYLKAWYINSALLLRAMAALHLITSPENQSFKENDNTRQPDGLRSRVVYKFACAGCNACFVGETTQHFSTRLREHLVSDRASHIFKHLENSDHCHDLCSVDCFHILDHASTTFQLKIKKRHFIFEENNLL